MFALLRTTAKFAPWILGGLVVQQSVTSLGELGNEGRLLIGIGVGGVGAKIIKS